MYKGVADATLADIAQMRWMLENKEKYYAEILDIVRKESDEQRMRLHPMGKRVGPDKP
jgi:hypothetical protein